MAATEGSARIQFKTLKGFPASTEDKLETQAFLSAAKEIVTVIGDNIPPIFIIFNIYFFLFRELRQTIYAGDQ